ncbi:nucleoside phosphorylase domain-containing protein [Cladorrhinum sp. PSN332]|nr:nucleoside phosphorylase domain-containing protein [Cladorrhinum sp. PSN332]
MPSTRHAQDSGPPLLETTSSESAHVVGDSQSGEITTHTSPNMSSKRKGKASTHTTGSGSAAAGEKDQSQEKAPEGKSGNLGHVGTVLDAKGLDGGNENSIPVTQKPAEGTASDKDVLESKVSHLDNEDYTIGWICTSPIELNAAEFFLSSIHGIPREKNRGDDNIYILGDISRHNVVMASMPVGQYGTAAAAAVTARMLQSFPNVRFGLSVGVAGGVPIQGNRNIHLGDIVVGFGEGRKHGGVIQYDYGKEVQGKGFEETHFLNQAPEILRAALARLLSWKSRGTEALSEDIATQICRMLQKKTDHVRRQLTRPLPETDRLYKPNIAHQRVGCQCENGQSVVESDVIMRDTSRQTPAIHYGLIGSGNSLIKNALRRDELAAKHPYLCFEMAASGIVNQLPCLVVRGICDYADSHSNEIWQPHAALVAAAYGRVVLAQIPPTEMQRARRFKDQFGEVCSG